MTEKEYNTALSKMRGSRINDIISALNSRTPKEEAGLKNEAEEKFFDNLTKEAEAHLKKYGDLPTFAPVEIESDDPRLDIYSSSVDLVRAESNQEENILPERNIK